MPTYKNYMFTFSQLNLPELIQDAVKTLGYETPTPIQQEIIPLLLDSPKDVIGLAQTGTGKTAAFGLPAIARTDVSKNHIQTFILSPTRELCLQITKDLKSYAQYIDGIHIVPIYGGSSSEAQIRQLRKGAHIVVATPGRAKDLIGQGRLKLNKTKRVILDEADEMLSMGFKEDLNYILDKTSKDRQTLLFSATMSKDIKRIVNTYLNDPVEIKVDKINSGSDNVSHLYYMAHAKNRYEVLKRVVDSTPDIYGIIFCRTRRETKEVSNKLMQEGYNADVLHGELSQNMRDDVMKRFRERKIQLLVATDVAARGVDVQELTHVINYNLPDDDEVYTHRSGRTGRAGNLGVSIVIIHTRELKKIQNIEKNSGIRFTRELIPTGEEVCQKQLYVLIDKVKSIEVDEGQIGPFLTEIYAMLEGLDRKTLIKHFVSAEFNRFLSYYKGSGDINVSQAEHQSIKNSVGNQSFTRFFINIGKRDGVNPAKLIGLINEALDSNDTPIGRIEILNNFSFFEIDSSMEKTITTELKGVPYGNMVIDLEPSKKQKSSRSGRRSKSKSSRNGSKNSQQTSNNRRKSGKKGKGSKSRKRGWAGTF